ncbi:MAG: thiol methyltransferase, partial [Myxococcales bacterium]|nr:thiol methyltransferase [Myxococcales bacterium]
LVVGCGRGHEARALASRGAKVVAVDFAAGALAEARALAAEERLSIDFRQRDLFTLPNDPERYDLVLEHCCFCAIDPARRVEYVDVVADMLADDGELVGLFWSHGKPGGPPFTVDAAELERLFSRRFVLTHLGVPEDSIERRRGQELLAHFHRR